MKKLIFFISLWFSFTIQASQINECDESISQLTCDSTPEVERLLDWAQTEFPDLLQGGYSTFVLQGYIARYYSKHKLYLGSKDSEVYGLGHVLGGFVHFGTLDELLESTPKFSKIINTTLLPNNEITITTSLGNALIHSTGDEPTDINVDNVVNTNGESSIFVEMSGGQATIKLPEIPKQDITQKSTLLKRQRDSDYPLTEIVVQNKAWFLSASVGWTPNQQLIKLDGISHARLHGNTIEHIGYTAAELNKGWMKYGAQIHVASQLLSVCSRQWVDGLTNCGHQDKIPVLFIHGFQPELTGFNINNNGGEKYWKDFPNIMLKNGYLPFEFKWLTNARFEDVAYDLAKAINTIYTATGKKKVHIVAHSFGGILLRTLLQVGPKKASEIINGKEVYSTTPVTDMIATVTTVGTPHSGIADKQKEMHGMEFPQGQDKDGADLFEGCGQLSCQLMGEDVISSLIGKIFIVDGEPGKWAEKLADTKNNLPNLNIQVLIGFALHAELNDKNTREFELRTSMGDLLISGYGQRFLPSLALDHNDKHAWSPLLSDYKVGNARVSEFILGRSSVDDVLNSPIQSLKPELSLGSYLVSDYLADKLKLYVPFIHSGGTLDDHKPDYHYSKEVCIGCGKEGPNPEYHDTVQRVLNWMGNKLECNSDETLQYNADGAAYCDAAISTCIEGFNSLQPGESVCGFHLNVDGTLIGQNSNVFGPLIVSTDIGSGTKYIARTVKLFPQSPSGRYRVIQGCDGVNGGGECWAIWIYDKVESKLYSTHAGKYGPMEWINWSHNEEYIILSNYFWLHIIDPESGMSQEYPPYDSSEKLAFQLDSFKWVSNQQFEIYANPYSCSGPDCVTADQSIKRTVDIPQFWSKNYIGK